MPARSRRRGAEAPSQRQLKVGEQMRHRLAEALLRGEVHDPRLRMADVTVLEVRMTRDLRHATVFVNQLGREGIDDEAMAALQHAAGFLAGRVAREMSLKYAPRLHFEADETLGRVGRLEQLLDEGLGRDRREH